MLILIRSDIPLYFLYTLTFEIFQDKLLVIHLEVILHILQGYIIVAYHQIGIFAHDMHLLYLLFVELTEHTIVFLFITQSAVLDTTDVHGVIEHMETSLQFQGTNLRQVEQCFFYIFQLYIPYATKQVVSIDFKIIQQLYY